MSHELGRNIFEATVKASREISRFRPKPERGLKYLEPYLNIDAIDELEKMRSERILGLYSATVADCYREKGDVSSAAQWYRRASTFRMSCGFTNLYAEMVIKHKLSDYYEHALMCVEQGHKEWKENLYIKEFFIGCYFYGLISNILGWFVN